MYVLKKVKTKKRKKKHLKEYSVIGFVMPTRSKKIKINDMIVTNIIIMEKKLANPLVTQKVNRRYKRLIFLLTELLISDEDDDGSVYEEVLNQIEKFRMEIKNKYRMFLEKKDLQLMSKQLKILQKEAKNKYLETQLTYQEMIGKSR